MPFRPIPFLTRAERQMLAEACIRTPDGCLIYTAPRGLQSQQIVLRGQVYSVARVAWAEAFAITVALAHQLNVSEVIHVAECPHTGFERNGVELALCIEPSHLMLGDSSARIQQSIQRRTVY